MLFNSAAYIFLFLPVVVVFYYVLLKFRLIVVSKIWLVLASVLFYSWWDPKYTALLLISMLLNFGIGSAFLSKYFEDKTKRKFLLIFGLTLNILILGYFKYANFFIDNLNFVLHTDIQIAKIILPLGISFFTFTQIIYLVDAYKKEAREYDVLSYLLFVTFFPHLIAGPILHHGEMMPQFNDIKRKVLKYKNIISGLFLFIIGLFKKTIIADTLSIYVANGYPAGGADATISIIEGWIIVISYTLQIYFDFSGYTDMALGSAKMLNIDLPINFNSPYKAISVQDFWKRWHITLSRFLRDYIYIPLGGNRKGEIRMYSNLLTTMLIGGLWHGASWMFVFWGALHGIAQIINKLWQKTHIELPKPVSIFITFMFINFTWIIFRAENLMQAKNIFMSLFDINNFIIPRTHHLDFIFHHSAKYPFIIVIFTLALLIVFLCPNSNKIVSMINVDSKKSAVFYSFLFAIIFIAAIIKLCCVPYSEFIYFNF